MKETYQKLIRGEDVRETLSALRNIVKEEEKRKALAAAPKIAETLTGLLHAEDAKTRKNAALLAGDLGLSETKEALLAAYKSEQTLFVKSAYLAALKQIGAPEMLPYFKERLTELRSQPAPEEEKKHRGEEIRELTQILAAEEGVKKHPFSGFAEPHEMLLVTNREQREVTLSEVHGMSASVRRTAELHPLGVLVFSKDVKDVARLRTYRELFFPLHKSAGQREPLVLGANLSPAEAAEALWESDLFSMLSECHEGETPFFFRIGTKGTTLGTAYVQKLGSAIEQASGWRMMNATADYEMELRLVQRKDGDFVPLVKLFTIPVKRFPYRKHATATSMHPANAAMLMQLAKPYLKENAQVLDPCCGVGTLLIERDICVPAREMYGIDTFGDAIEGARENATLAGEQIHFIHRDFLDFKHDYPFDEIIADMPDRGKRTREEQDVFYAAFLKKAKSLLTPDGVLMLYTNEEGFVKKQLRLIGGLKLLKEYCIRKKDRYFFYIIGMKG